MGENGSQPASTIWAEHFWGIDMWKNFGTLQVKILQIESFFRLRGSSSRVQSPLFQVVRCSTNIFTNLQNKKQKSTQPPGHTHTDIPQMSRTQGANKSRMTDHKNCLAFKEVIWGSP